MSSKQSVAWCVALAGFLYLAPFNAGQCGVQEAGILQVRALVTGLLTLVFVGSGILLPAPFEWLVPSLVRIWALNCAVVVRTLLAGTLSPYGMLLPIADSILAITAFAVVLAAVNTRGFSGAKPRSTEWGPAMVSYLAAVPLQTIAAWTELLTCAAFAVGSPCASVWVVASGSCVWLLVFYVAHMLEV